MTLLRIFSFILITTSVLSCQSTDETQRPNIIFILADDMGYGDVSAYHAEGKLKTKNIDRLANEGIRFTDAHTSSSVCTPTRYSILTGRYNWRTWAKQGVLWSWDEPLIDKDRSTVASILKTKGYQTGAVGKWHLGLGWQKDSAGGVDVTKPLTEGPLDNGFDYFFGITASLDIPPYLYIENDRITTMAIDTINERRGKGFWRKGAIGDDFTHEGVLPKLTDKAVEFIDRNAQKENPFFLYFPLPAPHTPILPTEEFAGKSKTNEYGDFVLMVDDVVGQVMKALKANGIDENTLVVFTTDNGCSPMADFKELAEFDHDPSAGFRGHKADIYEGGHRVPFVVRWPKGIKSPGVSSSLVCTTDFMATCADIVGYSVKDEEAEDSFSFLTDLTGEGGSKRPDMIHHSIDGAFAIRKGPWKLAMTGGSGGWSYPTNRNLSEMENAPAIQLFNLDQDPGEKENLATDSQNKVQELTDLLNGYIKSGRSTVGAAQKNDSAPKWDQLWWLDETEVEELIK